MLYFDHAASTDTFSEIIKKISEKTKILGNPSSVHKFGQEAHSIIDKARYEVAKYLEVNLENIIFTSGATESLNLAIIGHFFAIKNKDNRENFRILVSPLNHSSVFNALEFLSKNFGVEIKKLPINKNGFIDLEKISEKELSKSFMVICEHGNSEIGLIQPIAKLGKKIKKIKGEKPKLIVDTAASIVDMEISLKRQVCDGLVLSGEKFGGLKGSGIFLRHNDFKINSLIGGSQEFGYRGGTENLLGIWAIAKALKLLTKNRSIYHEKNIKYHKLLSKFFIQKFPTIKILTPKENYLSHIFSFILPFGSANIFVQQCDLLGLAISSGSACSSGDVKGSSVLKKLGCSEVEKTRGIRISFGRKTTMENVKKMIIILEKILKINDF